jgi:hypothetical protein
MVRVGTIGARDLDLLLLTDSVNEAMAHIQKHSIERFGLVRREVPRRSRVLGEKLLEGERADQRGGGGGSGIR